MNSRSFSMSRLPLVVTSRCSHTEQRYEERLLPASVPCPLLSLSPPLSHRRSFSFPVSSSVPFRFSFSGSSGPPRIVPLGSCSASRGWSRWALPLPEARSKGCAIRRTGLVWIATPRPSAIRLQPVMGAIARSKVLAEPRTNSQRISNVPLGAQRPY